MRDALRRSACLVVLGLLGGPVACDPATGPVEETDAPAYNVTFRLTSREPVRFLFAGRGKETGYLLEMASRLTRLSRLDGGKAVELAAAPQSCLAGSAKTLVVKRRVGVIRVECGGRLVLSAADTRYEGGSASFPAIPAGARVEGLLIQPVGEVECGDDFLPDSQVARDWQRVSGKWSVDSYRDPMMGEDQGPVGASWLTARGEGPCLLVGGEAFWEDLSLQAIVRLARGNTAGLVFNYRDPHNYGLFRVTDGRPGSAALDEVVGGKRRSVAKVPWTGDLHWWRRLRVETAGPFARASVDGTALLRGTLSACSDGRVGLFADGGTEALFDDLDAHSFRLLHDTLAPADLALWRRDGGTWKATRGGLDVRPASRALASPAAGTWSDLSASLLVDPAPGTEAGLAFRARGKGAGYALTLRRESGGGRWLLKRLDGEKAQVLASAPAPARGGWRRLDVRAVGGRLQAYGDGVALPVAYDFGHSEGTVSLLADGHSPASFSALEVGGPVAERAAGLVDVDFSKAQVRGLNKPGGQFEFLRPLGDILVPASSAWAHDLRAGALRARAAGSTWFWDAWEGDMGIACTVGSVPAPGSAGLLLCGDGQAQESGYRLALEGAGSLVLYRKGQAVARGRITGGVPEGVVRLELQRDGAFVVGRAGEARLAFRETEPLAGDRAGIWSGCRGPVFDDLSVWLNHATDTPFDRVDTDWRPASGEWMLHSGMTCIPWTYWIRADARKEPALMWYRSSLPRDFEILFRVSETSEGNEAGEHRHFPYHDIRLVLCGSPDDPALGYALILGADGGRTTRLLRNGKVAAESRSLPIEMQGHCNEPRQIHVRVRRQGGSLKVWGNGAPILSYDDPQPLAGRQAALGLNGCRANFRDFILCADRTWLADTDWPAAAAAR